MLLFPDLSEFFLKNILEISFIASILASSLEIIDPIKRIMVNNIRKEFYHEFDYVEKNDGGEKEKKRSWDIALSFNSAIELKQVTMVFNKITGMFYLIVILAVSPYRLNLMFLDVGIVYHNILSLAPYLLIPFVLKYTLYEYKEVTKKILISCFYLSGISQDIIDYYHEIENSLKDNNWSRAWSYLERETLSGRLEFDPEEMGDNILSELKKTWIGKMAVFLGIKMVI